MTITSALNAMAPKNTINLNVTDKIFFGETIYEVRRIVNDNFHLKLVGERKEEAETFLKLSEKEIIKRTYFDADFSLLRNMREGAVNDNLELCIEAFSDKSIEDAKQKQLICKRLHEEFGEKIPEKEGIEFLKKLPGLQDNKIKKTHSLRRTRSYYKYWMNRGCNYKVLINYNWKKGGHNKVTDIIDVWIVSYLDDSYLQRSRPKPCELKKLVEYNIIEYNKDQPDSAKLKMPCDDTFTARILKLDPKTALVELVGKDEAKKKLDLYFDSTKQTTRPLQRVQIDHTRADVQLKCRDGVFRRPWLTVMIDQHTRMIVGFWLSFENCSVKSVLMCLRQAVKSKELFLAEYPDLKTEWPVHGMIEEIVCDNGLEFHAKELFPIYSALGVQHIEYCHPKAPYQKGVVERVFRTFNTQFFHNLDGNTKGNTVEKGENYDPRDFANLYIEDLIKLFTSYVVDEYHNTHHRGINKTPLKAWQEGVAKEPINLPADGVNIDEVTCKAVSDKIVHKYGITLKNRNYWSPELHALNYEEMRKLTVTIKWDPEDNSYIWVLNPNTKNLFKVPCVTKDKAVGCRAEYARILDKIGVTESNCAKNREAVTTSAKNRLELQVKRREEANDNKPTRRKPKTIADAEAAAAIDLNYAIDDDEEDIDIDFSSSEDYYQDN